MKICPICKTEFTPRQLSAHFSGMDDVHLKEMRNIIFRVGKLFMCGVSARQILADCKLPFSQAWVAVNVKKLGLARKNKCPILKDDELNARVENVINSTRLNRKAKRTVTMLDRYGTLFKDADWNKGLTKESDSRIKKMSDSLQGRIPWTKGLSIEDVRVKSLIEKGKTTKISLYGNAFGDLSAWSKFKGTELAKETGRKGSETRLARYGDRFGVRTKKYYNTLPERLFRKELFRKDIKHKFQALIGGYRVDFYFPKVNTIIEVDGCYWHGCKKHFPNLKPQQVKQQLYDRNRDIVFEKLGNCVVHVWECDIKTDVVSVVNSLKLLNT